MDTSVRPPRVLTRSFPLMTVPFTAGAPCSYWTLTCIAVSSALHSLMGFLFVRPVVCLQLPSDSTSRWTPLLFSYPLPTAGQGRDFHPIERAPAGRTIKKAGTPTKVPAFFYSQTGVIGMMIFLNPPPVLIIGLSSCCNLSEKAYTIFRICARR